MENPSKRFKSLSPLPYVERLGDIVQDYNYSSAMILQINNCVSRKLHLHSFSWYLALEFNYADPYQHRKMGPYPNLAASDCRPQPGSIQILQPPTGCSGPTFACLYSQYKMGKCNSTYYLNFIKVDEQYRHMSLYEDTYPHRLGYFNECLNKLTQKLIYMHSIDTIVLPKFIGCGMAGGEWYDYEEIISRFCLSIKMYRPDITVYVVQKKKNNAINQ